MSGLQAAARPAESARPATARAAPVEVRSLRTGEDPVWEDFIARQPSAVFFQRPAWGRAVEIGTRQAVHPLGAWRGRELVGVLPLVHVKSRLFGDALVSAGFAVVGGIAAQDDEASQALADAAAELGRTLKVGHIELRHEKPIRLAAPWVLRPGPFCGFLREISHLDETNLKAIPRKKRADLRKALNDPRLRVETDVDAKTLHAIYARSVRDLGTPVFPRRLFLEAKKGFGEAAEISAVVGPNGPVAAVMTFYFKDRVMPYFGGALPEARAFHAYDLLYWEVMRRAAMRGCHVFDFGRSKRGTGSFDYKTYWGFEPEPLGYQYLPLQGDRIPEINPLNPKYQLMISAWKRLPLPAANLLGPLISRQLG